MRSLILGGARSGKSRLAECMAQNLAETIGLAVTYVATAMADDEEMSQRIEHHRQRRRTDWRTIETPIALAATIEATAAPDSVVLVDCLTLWITNCLCADQPGLYEQERDALLAGLDTWPGEIILVSNETGLGVVPMGALSRRFCDESGWLHQALAARCDRVVFTVAGLPQILKGDPLPVLLGAR
ncbi:MAG: bifunctional adenosylcobinamide kinase/adenosylcobinamide-phosphate guanylyltransferase [Gammaproteobacteria bacterium]|nr:bifunctional adenosylcobinamide kinase/adenosylcobinamide-phosphate guanylyltransferase [Gammaproteobacteria bacterium]MCP5135337.1 bifunctional adenosylcobinamide kinase/adenosylcobinamide-phosphate guanylyltransferase [Gammaproteobacteria bacterium]